jgi:Tol biopolymer transport system component
VYESYDIFLADTSGIIIKQLTKEKGYDAEATLSPDGKNMIFTSVRNGDLDLYVMDLKLKKLPR